jgi:hypothetical protein
MTKSVRSADVEAASGPTTSTYEFPLLTATYEVNVGWLPNLTYKSGSPLLEPDVPVVLQVTLFERGTAM